jgi:VIT1/CCC1 family predicted Fe2+/Mn2+ transporter
MSRKKTRKQILTESIQVELDHTFSTGIKTRLSKGMTADNLSELLNAIRAMKEKVQEEVMDQLAEKEPVKVSQDLEDEDAEEARRMAEAEERHDADYWKGDERPDPRLARVAD